MPQLVELLARSKIELTRTFVIADSKVIGNSISITLREFQSIRRTICRVATHLNRRLPHDLCEISPRWVRVDIWFMAIVGISICLRVVKSFGDQSTHFCGGITCSCALAVTIFGRTIHCSVNGMNVSILMGFEGAKNKSGCTYKFISKTHWVVICLAISARPESQTRAGDE